jgi:hypothetical protein
MMSPRGLALEIGIAGSTADRRPGPCDRLCPLTKACVATRLLSDGALGGDCWLVLGEILWLFRTLLNHRELTPFAPYTGPMSPVVPVCLSLLVGSAVAFLPAPSARVPRAQAPRPVFSSLFDENDAGSKIKQGLLIRFLPEVRALDGYDA